MSANPNPDEIRRTLAILDELPRAEPSPDFEKRLYERIESMPENQSPVWLTRIKWSVAAMLILSITNAFTIYRQNQPGGDDALISLLWSDDSSFDTNLIPDIDPDLP